MGTGGDNAADQGRVGGGFVLPNGDGHQFDDGKVGAFWLDEGLMFLPSERGLSDPLGETRYQTY